MSGSGPFTVFAPTDAAFEKLPAGALDSVLQKDNNVNTDLSFVLGKYIASDVKKLTSVTTVQGSAAKVEVHRPFHRGFTIDDVQVIHPNIACTNGMIHVIDSVLMPK